MNGRTAVTCGAALLSALACSRPPVFDEAHQVAIRDSLGVFLEAYRQYSATGNWEALLGLYADGPDFRWIEDGAVAYESVAAIRQAIDAAPAGIRIVTTHDDVRITPLAPGLAWISLRFASMYLERSGAGYGLTGASTMVVRHDSAGWRIVGGHASTRRDSSAVE